MCGCRSVLAIAGDAPRSQPIASGGFSACPVLRPVRIMPIIAAWPASAFLGPASDSAGCESRVERQLPARQQEERPESTERCPRSGEVVGVYSARPCRLHGCPHFRMVKKAACASGRWLRGSVGQVRPPNNVTRCLRAASRSICASAFERCRAARVQRPRFPPAVFRPVQRQPRSAVARL